MLVGKLALKYSHRLLCGDSTNIADVERLMDGEKADMCFTSPPYNGNTKVDSSGSYGNNEQTKLYKNNKNDNKLSSDYVSFLGATLSNAAMVTDGFIFWNINYNANARFEYLKSMMPFVDMLHETIIWKKHIAHSLAHGLTRICELIFCFKTSERRANLGKKHEMNSTLWEISNVSAQVKGEHHACFPVALPEKGIELATEPGESVLDLFGGSGTTLIACEKLNRKCFIMELEPRYCDVIIKRYEDYTNKKAVLAR